MSEIQIQPGDSFDLALKRFNRKVQHAGMLAEARRRRYHESSQDRRKRKIAIQQRRRRSIR
jgi:small subunit ribosomal protein S21